LRDEKVLERAQRTPPPKAVSEAKFKASFGGVSILNQSKL